MTTDTPRTDALERWHGPALESLLAHLSRTLERELAARDKTIETLKAELGRAARAIENLGGNCAKEFLDLAVRSEETL